MGAPAVNSAWILDQLRQLQMRLDRLNGDVMDSGNKSDLKAAKSELRQMINEIESL